MLPQRAERLKLLVQTAGICCSTPKDKTRISLASLGGRVEERGAILRPVAPSAIDFAFARTIVAVQNRRTEKWSGLASCETRCYLSSLDAEERIPRRLDRTHARPLGQH